jgi:RNA polymerase sigma factor (sigma-70 family)
VVTASAEEAQDVVSEAFMRVLDRLQHGGGPEGELSPYLNTIVRRLAIDRYRASRREGLPADPMLFEVMPVSDDPIARSTDRDLVRRAFETLPDRWQQVLWHTEIEGRSPAGSRGFPSRRRWPARSLPRQPRWGRWLPSL